MNWPVVFEFLRPQKEYVTPDAGQNPGATKIPLPLRAGDKNVLHTFKIELESISMVLNFRKTWLQNENEMNRALGHLCAHIG